jgi:hypothetical protein
MPAEPPVERPASPQTFTDIPISGPNTPRHMSRPHPTRYKVKRQPDHSGFGHPSPRTLVLGLDPRVEDRYPRPGTAHRDRAHSPGHVKPPCASLETDSSDDILRLVSTRLREVAKERRSPISRVPLPSSSPPLCVPTHRRSGLPQHRGLRTHRTRDIGTLRPNIWGQWMVGPLGPFGNLGAIGWFVDGVAAGDDVHVDSGGSCQA